MSLIGVGDNTVDKYLDRQLMFPGGNAVNVPVLAHRSGLPASYIGCIGSDAPGNMMASSLKAEGIDISHCRFLQGANAYCEVSLVRNERIFGNADRGVSTRLQLEAEDLEFIGSHEITHTSIHSHMADEIRCLSQASHQLSFDFSNRWNREILDDMLPWVKIAFLSYPEHDVDETRALMVWMQSRGPRIVVVTRGKEGSAALEENQFAIQGTSSADVVDTLGAGDSFAARFLVEYLNEKSLEERMALAAVSAAETCASFGAFGHGIPLK